MFADRFTICALLYGDYPQLARRCLGSIAPVADATGVELRIGMNAVSDATRAVVTELFTDATYPVLAVDSRENRCKYPLMRHLFYELDGGIKTPLVMWFDDDSCVKDPAQGLDWLASLNRSMAGIGMLGARYTKGWEGKQREWVRAQPWYGGYDPAERPKASFIQGAWWVANMAILRELDYPWPELHHRGGDVMLGEALFQKDIEVMRYSDNVAINADTSLRESKALRRGVDEKPLGFGGPSSLGTVAVNTEMRRQVALAAVGGESWPLPPVQTAPQKKWLIPRL